MQIQYNPENIRKKALECSILSNSVSFSKENIYSEIGDYSEGLVQEKLALFVEQTDKCSTECVTLIAETTLFMNDIANYLENQDQRIAKKVGE